MSKKPSLKQFKTLGKSSSYFKGPEVKVLKYVKIQNSLQFVEDKLENKKVCLKEKCSVSYIPTTLGGSKIAGVVDLWSLSRGSLCFINTNWNPKLVVIVSQFYFYFYFQICAFGHESRSHFKLIKSVDFFPTRCQLMSQIPLHPFF